MPQNTKLKRELGLFEVTLAGVGVILGAGVYALIGHATEIAGNAVWLSFATAALIAVFTGLSYAELSSMYPKASAEYAYTNHAFGQKLAFIIGWLITFSGIIAASTVALGFGGYFNALLGYPILHSALLLIFILSFVLFYGIKTSAWLAIVFTLIEVSGLIFVIYIGLPHWGSVDYLDMPHGLKGVFEAAALIFFAYMGFEDVVKLSEETKDPERAIPKALVLAMVITIVLYILVAISVVSVVPWQVLGSSDAPFADVASLTMGKDAFILISIIALFATANTVLLMMLAASRVVYGMADSFSLPSVLAIVHPRRKTPWTAILSIMLLSMLFVFVEDIAFVANVNNFILFVTFVVINASLIVLRFKEPNCPRPFRVPFSIGKLPLLPVMGIFTCLFLTWQLEHIILLIGSSLALLGGLVSLFCSRSSN